ncbi:MAG: XRE family transcriptional regulator [Clostridia bacterium]|nr:XRE family transcriptional regulator [Clostridia bacterium]
MIGDMLAKARKDKGMTKTDLARITNINIGHLTHIEKGERNPSHKALKVICNALKIPYQPLMFTYDKEINEEQQSYAVTDCVSYDKILLVDKIGGFVPCPPKVSGAAFALKVPDNSMEPTFAKDSNVFVELNSPLNSKDYGLFELNGSIIIRKFFSKKGKISLKADNKELEEIKVSPDDNFYIIGKVLKNK